MGIPKAVRRSLGAASASGNASGKATASVDNGDEGSDTDALERNEGARTGGVDKDEVTAAISLDDEETLTGTDEVEAFVVLDCENETICERR